MNYTYSVSYIACQTCKTKIYCDRCENQLEESIIKLNGTRSVSLQLLKKALSIDTDINEDDLLDELESLGIFAD